PCARCAAKNRNFHHRHVGGKADPYPFATRSTGAKCQITPYFRAAGRCLWHCPRFYLNMTPPNAILEARDANEVLERVKNSGSSFLLGMMAVPHARRRAMFALYAFCRVVDDIADGEAPEAWRLAQLQEWRAHVERLFTGHASHPVMELLLPAVSEYSL